MNSVTNKIVTAGESVPDMRPNLVSSDLPSNITNLSTPTAALTTFLPPPNAETIIEEAKCQEEETTNEDDTPSTRKEELQQGEKITVYIRTMMQ